MNLDIFENIFEGPDISPFNQALLHLLAGLFAGQRQMFPRCAIGRLVLVAWEALILFQGVDA